MWDLVVTVPDHCLSFNFGLYGIVFEINHLKTISASKDIYIYIYIWQSVWDVTHLIQIWVFYPFNASF